MWLYSFAWNCIAGFLTALLIAVILGVATGQNCTSNFLYHVRWWGFAMWYRIVGRDTKKPKGFPTMPPRPRLNAVNGQVRVRLIFVRHGDSEWNALFNRFGLGWPLRIVSCFINSMKCWYFRHDDDVLIDSPLSSKGIQQTVQLADFVRSGNPVGGFATSIPVDPRTSVVVSSNLRRAMATALLGLKPRLASTKEKVVIDSSLQEGSNNPDAHSLMVRPYHLADAPVLTYKNASQLTAVFDPMLNEGNKPLNSNLYQRIDTFAARALGGGSIISLNKSEGEGPRPFRVAEPPTQVTDPLQTLPREIIAVGHSLWIKGFFNRYLPDSSKHPSKSRKLQNCAVVQCDLVADAKFDGGQAFIDESSIKVLHGNFVGLK